jgi:hypothetical protein
VTEPDEDRPDPADTFMDRLVDDGEGGIEIVARQYAEDDAETAD